MVSRSVTRASRVRDPAAADAGVRPNGKNHPQEDQEVSQCNTPDTPGICPDTPEMEFLVHVIFVLWAPQPLKTISLSLSQLIPCLPLLSLHLTPSSALPLPKP